MAKLMSITIPKWGIEMERGTIAAWRVAIGDSVSRGDELVDIETDKIVNSFEADGDGILVRILAEEGEELDVGTLIGVLASEQVPDAEIDAFIAATTGAAAKAPKSAETAAEQATAAGESAADAAARGAVKISPALRRKAERLSVDIASLTGSGYGGRILRDDIEAAAAGGASASAQAQPLRQLQGAQKTIAERMTLAKQTIPHFYLHRDCAMDKVLDALQVARASSDVAVTVNHVIVHAVARALKQYPELNLNVLSGGIRQLATADVAIAVDTGDSLLTPVVRDIGDAGLAAVASAAADIVDRTRSRQLRAGDLDGGAVTVSNLGMLGVTSFTAIINPPQVMILAVGAIQERVTLDGDKPAIKRACSLTLACDHRVINGAAGARFLAAVCETIEAGP